MNAKVSSIDELGYFDTALLQRTDSWTAEWTQKPVLNTHHVHGTANDAAPRPSVTLKDCWQNATNHTPHHSISPGNTLDRELRHGAVFSPPRSNHVAEAFGKLPDTPGPKSKVDLHNTNFIQHASSRRRYSLSPHPQADCLSIVTSREDEDAAPNGEVYPTQKAETCLDDGVILADDHHMNPKHSPSRGQSTPIVEDHKCDENLVGGGAQNTVEGSTAVGNVEDVPAESCPESPSNPEIRKLPDVRPDTDVRVSGIAKVLNMDVITPSSTELMINLTEVNGTSTNFVTQAMLPNQSLQPVSSIDEFNCIAGPRTSENSTFFVEHESRGICSAQRSVAHLLSLNRRSHRHRWTKRCYEVRKWLLWS